MEKNNKSVGYVFVSHSHEDIDKVRIIRNILEEQGFEPILFYLKSFDKKLDKKTEEKLKNLIFKEIDAREIFLYCDSKNAKKSEWVKEEYDYVMKNYKNSSKYICEINRDDENIRLIVQNLIRHINFSIIYNSKDKAKADLIKDCLSNKDYKVTLVELDQVDHGKTLLNTSEFGVNIVLFTNNIDKKTQYWKLDSLIEQKNSTFVISYNKAINNYQYNIETNNVINFDNAKNVVKKLLSIVKEKYSINEELNIKKIKSEIKNSCNKFDVVTFLEEITERNGFLTPETEFMSIVMNLDMSKGEDDKYRKNRYYLRKYFESIKNYIIWLDKQECDSKLITDYVEFVNQNNILENLYLNLEEFLDKDIMEQYTRKKNTDHYDYLETVYSFYIKTLLEKYNDPITMLLEYIKRYRKSMLDDILNSIYVNNRTDFKKTNNTIPFIDFKFIERKCLAIDGLPVVEDYNQRFQLDSISCLETMDIASKFNFDYLQEEIEDGKDVLRKFNDMLDRNSLAITETEYKLNHFYDYVFFSLVKTKKSKKYIDALIEHISTTISSYDIEIVKEIVRDLNITSSLLEAEYKGKAKSTIGKIRALQKDIINSSKCIH